MSDEIEVEREIDPTTGNLVKTVTERLGDEPGEFVRTTTHYTEGRKKIRVKETFRRPPDDPRARSNLVMRETTHYAEDGQTPWLEVVELFGNGVNETPLSKTETEWDVPPANPRKRWLRFVRHFTWDPAPPPGRWVKHTTVELNDNGTLKGVTHP